MNDRTEETVLAAALGLLVEGVAVTLFLATVFVWLVIAKTGGLP